MLGDHSMFTQTLQSRAALTAVFFVFGGLIAGCQGETPRATLNPAGDNVEAIREIQGLRVKIEVASEASDQEDSRKEQ